MKREQTVEQVRWTIVKNLLEESPELRIKCLKYVRQTEKRELKTLMKKHLPPKVYERVLILYNEKDC